MWLTPSAQRIRLRKFPFPSRAALSNTNDIDSTDTVEQHQRIQAIMNEEIGIIFTDTFYPYYDENNFSFLSDTSMDKKIIFDHIDKGLLEALYSFVKKRL